MSDSFISSLRRERAVLKEELARDPRHLRVKAIETAIRLHEDANEPPLGKYPRNGTTHAAVLRAVAAFLQTEDGPAQIAEITLAVQATGLLIGSKNPKGTVASYLCRADRMFNYKRGQGYSLIARADPSDSRPGLSYIIPHGHSANGSGFDRRDESSHPRDRA
jgi:hypothetical protein